MHFEDPSSPPFQNWHPQTPLSPTNTLPWHHFYQSSSSSSWFTTMIIMILTTYILWWGVHDLPKHSLFMCRNAGLCASPSYEASNRAKYPFLNWVKTAQSIRAVAGSWTNKNCIHHNFAFFLKDGLVWWSLALHGCFGEGKRHLACLMTKFVGL